jgi:hypothetical protein
MYCSPSTSKDVLFREFDLLLHDLFQKKLFYRQLIAAVAEKPLDLTGIYRKLSVHKAGYISDCIEELIEAGFLARHYTWNIRTAEPAAVSSTTRSSAATTPSTSARSSSARRLLCAQ